MPLQIIIKSKNHQNNLFYNKGNDSSFPYEADSNLKKNKIIKHKR